VTGRPPGPRVKVCGLTRREDAAAAEAAGARYLGVILAAGRARTLTASAAAAVLEDTGCRRVGVFVDAGRDALAAAAEAAGLDVLQLHGDEPPDLCAALREAGHTVWKAVRPRSGGEFAAAARRYSGAVDALLVDGWSPVDRGGTGARFPWAEVAAHRGAVAPGTRLVAAGGLTPANVGEAVRVLDPYAVDVSSGVEDRPGRKDHARIRDFVAGVRAAASASAPRTPRV
jgi:phosphoribosylanthranilate isomerase